MSTSRDLQPYIVLITAANAATRAKIAASLVTNFQLHEAATIAEALTCIEHHPIHALLIHNNLSDGTGVDACAQVAALNPSIARILFGASPTLPDALQAINTGHVWHYLTGDLSTQNIPALVEQAITGHRRIQSTLADELRAENLKLERKIEQRTRELVSMNEEVRAMLDRMQALTMTDELTGLYNRRMLTRNLDWLFKQSKRYGTALSCVVCDLDGFTKWNDRLGHDAGDTVLREVAARIRLQLRGVDVLSRTGGDAFTIIMPHTNSTQARVAVERLYAGLTEESYRIPEGEFRFTANFGIAEVTPSITEAVDLFRRAEQAEFLARQHAGDTMPIVIYPDPDHPAPASPSLTDETQ